MSPQPSSLASTKNGHAKKLHVYNAPTTVLPRKQFDRYLKLFSLEVQTPRCVQLINSRPGPVANPRDVREHASEGFAGSESKQDAGNEGE